MLREDPMQPMRGLLIRSGRLFKSVKETEVVCLSALPDVYLPCPAHCMPRHTLGARLVVFRPRHVSHVFTLRSLAQILCAVVVAATVDMIKTFTRPPTMGHGPHNAMGAQDAPINTYGAITQRQSSGALPCFHPLRCVSPIQSACRSVISKQLMQPGYSDLSVHSYGIAVFLSCRKEVGNGFA